MRIQSLNHSAYQHQYHVVWGTKHRRKWLKEYVKQEFIASTYNTVKKYPTLHVDAVNADQDHVHIQIEIPPNIAISDVVRRLKINSSKHIQKKFKFIREMYLEWDGIWSVGYFSSTVGLNEEQVRRYIEWQGKKEKPQTTTLF
jgi:putative transposase